MSHNPAHAPTPPTSGTGWYLVVAVLVMLAAAFFRINGLTDTPLGLSDEELISARLAEELVRGDIRLIYDNVSPAREGIYFALLGLTNTLYGGGLMMWRLPSVWLSLLTIAMTLRLMRELFGVRVGLLTAGLLATVFWPVWLGRAVIHVTLLPLFAALTFFVFARAYRAPTLTQSSLWFTLGSLILGFTLYVHVTAWTVPAVLAAFVIYRLILQPKEMGYHWSNIAYTIGLAVVISVPLILYLVNNPGAREPVPLSEQPDLIASLPGRLLSTASALVLRGDGSAVHNIPGRPVMGVALFVLAVIGVGVALGRFRRPAYGFVLLWAAVGLIPTALLPTTDFEIMAVVMPVLFVFPAIGLRALYLNSLTLIEGASWHTAADFITGLAALVLVVVTAVVTYEAYFQRWATLPEVELAYNTREARIAHYLDTVPDTTPVSVCSIPTGDITRPSHEDLIRIWLHRSDLNVRYFDCRTSLVIADGGRSQRMIFPNGSYYASVPGALLEWMRYAEPIPVEGLPPERVVRFEAEEALADRAGAFITTAPTAWPPEGGDAQLVGLPVPFDFDIDFLGYRLRDEVIVPSQPVEMVTYWRVNGQPPPNLTMFAHLLSNPVIIISQTDSLGVRTGSLQPRDIVLQYSRIPTPPGISAGLYPIAVGLYFPGQVDQRLYAYEAGEQRATRLFLQRVEVIR